ncbi:hypothetical protein GALMADRAFT_93153 [Galerina marginata CBS 339.88]|uniref:Transcription factor IIIC 90kDa subunit N-terminal domain-containing protein n=1 Tax=Galerina marginata (strain CBS 339.88) TaxID=685588 RepID=A0A067TJU4_GALM3|nr:hypothetical protein GALMADRAFT_93153 [Galerina marginata CBS 339.88]
MSKPSRDDPPIYTALVVPTVTSHPSLKTLQWSADGQVCFVTKNSAFILTPDHGINFDNASTIKSVPLPTKDKDDSSSLSSSPVNIPLPLGWFKTMIQHDKSTPVRWPDHSQAWGATSLGSLDVSLVSITISPSGVNINGGCVYATLSSNMDVNLWAAGKNYLKGEWVKISDVTPCLLNYVASSDDVKMTTASVLRAQTTCIEWTPQADFGLSPSPTTHLDASLLVLGSRAGVVTFLRHKKGADPAPVGLLSVADRWITHLAFSRWELVRPGECEGYLAFSVSDGSVGLVKVKQTLREESNEALGFAFTPGYEVEVELEHCPSVVSSPESRAAVTAMRWVLIPGRSAILVYATPGLIHLYSSPSPSPPPSRITASPIPWSGLLTLPLQIQKISVDCSPLHPVSGLTYLPKCDKLLVTLLDGSFHVVRGFAWGVPAWVNSGSGASDSETERDHVRINITSQALSGVSRGVFVRSEKESVDRGDMVRVNGAVGYDSDAGASARKCFMWVYESSRPSDFSYKHDAKHSSTLIVAQLWNESEQTEMEEDELLLQDLTGFLRTVKTSSGLSPLHLLRPFLFHLRNPGRLEKLHAGLLEVIQVPTPATSTTQAVSLDHSTKISVPMCDKEIDTGIRKRWRESLATHLFGWDELLSLRMRLSLADFAWKLATNEQRQAECGVVAQGLLNTISHRVLRTILRHLVAVVKLLAPNDIPFVSRVIVQSLLPGCPPDLAEEGKQLSKLIQPLVRSEPTSAVSGASVAVPSDELVNKLNEACPACGVEVPLHDITTAVCANKHSWARCSVTTFILSTPWVRTCVGCSRKAFLAPSSGKGLPPLAQGWVAEELLEAVNRCLFCNNGFVSIL